MVLNRPSTEGLYLFKLCQIIFICSKSSKLETLSGINKALIAFAGLESIIPFSMPKLKTLLISERTLFAVVNLFLPFAACFSATCLSILETSSVLILFGL